ncbi:MULTISPECIES: endonuclease/exonuclease/phosphatase family protein [unclassified Ruegeria]|uniref:endonuclease/exonuclease/phosphatase family protein n=1 Tax=unclassified Ruegeria TaxID=2625375 RepID=UPI00149156A0|nr:MULTISPECIES: endonuclease/exonuclease/phosphatase family protein [unclassified Ruegeria]NOD89459.1 endonuclease/exonuclease/phosphatase family protein [Ruegeria sp. HKCCD4318]NOE13782.1 endonuclease/exonuclease/phosphatase family protein [Ruegeria sp. HKCCD4318-2]NOG08283.1 endonuclease/exonuclease/phosphatase family protein [Ruegeria sp. HKCCD4315]
MKLTCWNAEWLDSAWGVVSGKYAPEEYKFPHKVPKMGDAKKRVKSVSQYIDMLDASILFLCEAPEGEDEMADFVKKHAKEYDLIKRGSGDGYATDGRQWQWFLVKKDVADRISPSLVPISTWRQFAAVEDPSVSIDGEWKVALPRLKTVGGVKDVPVSSRVSHSFYREPQILRFNFGGAQHEVIGAHLKSKFTGGKPRARKVGESFDDYLASSKKVREYIAASHGARVKLSSEALVIRAYIDRRFAQEADPSIFVVGDLNDGPGKELMEREYLLHDLISNLQGEVFFARKFLNHALFDQPTELRWTAKFKDSLDPEREEHILLDHILFSQALTRSGTSPLQVQSGAGRVEHLLHEEAEAKFGRDVLSDHRPVSVDMIPRVS